MATSKKLFMWQFVLWLLSLILWGVAHTGEPGLVLPVLTQLVFLGLAGYLVVRSVLIPEIVFAVGVFTTGVMWAIKSEDAPASHPDSQTVLILATIAHIVVFGLSLYILRSLKKDKETEEEILKAQMQPEPGFALPPPL